MLDAFQSNVVGRKYSSRWWCAVERWPSLHVVYWALFSAVDRILLVKWFCARIWRNMSRATSLMLRRGPCDCFIELCAAAGAMLALIVAIVTPFSSRSSPWLPNCYSPLHWGFLKYSARRTKRCFGDLAERTKIVMAWPGERPSERFPRNYYVDGTRSRKCEFLCFPDFIKNKSRSRANVFTADTKRILAVAMTFHETSCVQKMKTTVCFVAKTIWYYFFF